jgi:hypothetical protein
LRLCEQIKGQALQKTTQKTKQLNLQTNTLRISFFVEKVTKTTRKASPFGTFFEDFDDKT